MMEAEAVKKVMVFGTFDVLHAGHLKFLEEAKKLGGDDARLTVVIARDSTVHKVRGRPPIFSEEDRRKLVEGLKPVDEAILGYEGGDMLKIVEEKKIAGEAMTFVRGCKEPKAVTILVRGSTEHVVDEIDRSIEDAVGAVASALEVGKIVAGAGSPEAEIAKRLRKFAEKFSGREQLAILAFADAMEVIPKALAENGGLDPIDTLVELRAAHEQGKISYGINLYDGKVADAFEMGVIEPLKVKTQAIKSAAEAAEMILRIDDVIAAGKLEKTTPSPPPSESEE